MSTPASLVREFHEAFGVPIRTTPDLDVPERDLRRRLLAEETNEADFAIAFGDLPGAAQELADIVYVAYGAALTFGIDLDAVIAEVHRANMAKLGPDGTPVYREDGKVLKPEGWKAPDVVSVLAGSAGDSGTP